MSFFRNTTAFCAVAGGFAVFQQKKGFKHLSEFFNGPAISKVYAKAEKPCPFPLQNDLKVSQEHFSAAATAKGKAEQCAHPCPPPPLPPCPPPCPPRGCPGRTARNPCQPSQYNITSCPKIHSLYLTIHLNGSVDPGTVAKVAADIENLVVTVTDESDPCDLEVDAGVGFGPNFYNQVMGKTCKNFYYAARKGKNGELPQTSGDIFLHAKCNSEGKLFELCKNYICSFPEGSICEFEDIYGFDYRNGRDLSGFYVGSSTRCDEDGRKDVAIECETGGSYALVQKWVHDFCVIRPENKSALEKYIGRDMDNGLELKAKAASSHVARMTGTTENNVTPHFEMVGQSQNYGTLASDAGCYFLAFASDPAAFEFMLDQMVGAGCDGICDDLMKISKCVKGTYYYFPSRRELCALTQQCK